MKIWICICLLFLVHSILNLLDKRYEVIYSLDEHGNITDSIYILACVKVRLIANYAKKSKIDLDQLSSNLYRHLEHKFGNISGDHSKDHHSQTNLAALILDQVRSRNYLYISNLVCIITSDYKQQNEAQHLLGPESLRLVFKEDSFNVFHMDHDSSVQQLNVYSKASPYSNCSEDAHSDYASLYECFKNPNRFGKYIYHGHEDGLVLTDYDDTARQVVEHEYKCSERYLKNECRLVYLVPYVGGKRFEIDNKNIKAHPALNALDYWSQLIGLSCLVVGFSFLDLFNKLFKLVSSKIANNSSELIHFSPNSRLCRIGCINTIKLIAFINARQIRMATLRSCLLFIRLSILLIGLIFSLYLYTMMLRDYRNQIVDPIVKQSIANLIKPEEMHLVICVNLEYILRNQADETSSKKSHFNKSNFYSYMTLSEIEAETERGLTNTLVDLHLSFQNKAFPVEWSLKNRTLFRRHQNELSRCYQVVVRPFEAKFMQLISITKMVVKLRVPFRLYLLSRQERFSSKSFHFSGMHSFFKKVSKKLKSNRRTRCVDYEVTYRERNCTSRPNCVERCTHRKFINRHRNISVGTSDHPLVIDRIFFSDKEWAIAHPTEDKEAYESILSECQNKFSAAKQCKTVKYMPYFNLHQDTVKELSFDLYYDLVRSDEEQPSGYELLLDILNIQSILFGLTVLKLLKILRRFIQIKLKLNGGKVTTLIIYLLCSVGFVWHVYHIFDVIINGELTFSQHYTVAPFIVMPEMVFCFEIDRRLVDENHKLTGAYLEQVTSHLTPEKIFKSIRYLNESNRWADFRSVETFFFVASKCFSIALNITYPHRNFLFYIRNIVLKIYFNRKFIEQINEEKKKILFFTKTEGTLYFNKVIPLNYKEDQKSLSVVQIFYSLRYDWKFYLIKNPSALFFDETFINDSDAYLKRLCTKFGQTLDVATLNLFLKRQLFNREIRDDLFEIYQKLIQNQSDHNSPLNPNYERDFSIYHLTKEISTSNQFKLMYRIFFFKVSI